jgi:Thioredoxin like C-terminal domain
MGRFVAQGGVPRLWGLITGSTRAIRILLLSRRARQPMPFRGLVDNDAPGRSRGVDVDEDGGGVLRGGRRYHLVREYNAVRERTGDITLLEPGAEAYAFTFG